MLKKVFLIFSGVIVLSLSSISNAMANTLITFYTQIPILAFYESESILSPYSLNLENNSKDFYTNGINADDSKHTDSVLYVLEKFIKNTDKKCLFLKGPNQFNIGIDTNYMDYAIEYAHLVGSKIFFITQNATNKDGKINTLGSTKLYQMLIKKCKKYPDMLFLVSAGNTGESIQDYNIFNGEKIDNLMFVGSCDAYGKVSAFSTKGKVVEVYTLGQDIPIFYENGGYYSSESGTSLSTPIIAVLCADMLETNPYLQGRDLKNGILSMRNENYCIVNMNILRAVYLPLIK